ncbi:MAG: hypothetical protein RH942_14265 [Kiloniellaceae bacterium]
MVDSDRVERYIQQFEAERHLRVSEMARHLIVMTLDAIEHDPNPNWDAPMVELETFADRSTRDVPGLLGAVAEHGRIKDEITYFNVLHFLSSNLKSICPFPSE